MIIFVLPRQLVHLIPNFNCGLKYAGEQTTYELAVDLKIYSQLQKAGLLNKFKMCLGSYDCDLGSKQTEISKPLKPYFMLKAWKLSYVKKNIRF